MPEPLASVDDLADMWRPLLDSETDRAANLIDKASAMLRQNTPPVPSLDARIAMFDADPTSYQGLDRTLVATVVATIVKRFISNVEGVVSQTQTVGPFSQAQSYALRGDKDVRGEMQVTAGDLDRLRPYPTARARIGSIRIRPSMATGPFGGIGHGQVIDCLLLEFGNTPTVIGVPVPIYSPDRYDA
jgi:hypothetical protein